MLLLALWGCTETANEGYVLSGWNYQWESLSHRISLLDFSLEPGPSFDLGFIGGPYSTGVSATDTPLYRMRYEHITSPDVWFKDGIVEMEIGPEGQSDSADGSVSIDTSDVPEAEGMIALLRGISIYTDVEQGADYPLDTYDPSYGYTSGGFAFSLGTPTGSGSVDVPAHAQVRWLPQDRDDMNAAIPFAQTHVALAFTLVGYNGELQTADLSGGQTYAVDRSASLWVNTPQPPMTESVAFSDSENRSFVGWTGFDLMVNRTGDFSDTGDYMRAMGMEVVPTADGKGSWEGEVTTTIQTSSLIELTELTAAYSATLAQVSVPNAQVEHYVVEGSHPVGEALTPPL